MDGARTACWPTSARARSPSDSRGRSLFLAFFAAGDTYKGRTILVRYAWTATTTSSPHFEQPFSDDGGKTWEVNWTTDRVRVKE